MPSFLWLEIFQEGNIKKLLSEIAHLLLDCHSTYSTGTVHSEFFVSLYFPLELLPLLKIRIFYRDERNDTFHTRPIMVLHRQLIWCHGKRDGFTLHSTLGRGEEPVRRRHQQDSIFRDRLLPPCQYCLCSQLHDTRNPNIQLERGNNTLTSLSFTVLSLHSTKC